ncbi:hepatic and glial cell adhesion molecule-like [Aquarana catesbeiana]|uniref:hepatic and glial cell adhesion molecule-like n=1 Tax=Aquarana catesbeiana TaxID=8400 RepID=UPI003CC98C41
MNCDLSKSTYFPNTRISENGSLIISSVTLENDGTYSVYIHNSTGSLIQVNDYIIHVIGNIPEEEIFTWPGSDLLLPNRLHLTLNHTDRRRCYLIFWSYEKSPGDWKRIAEHTYCKLSESGYFPNTRISENGSLIISNVTLENDGIYRVTIRQPTFSIIQEDYYFINVEVPVSDPVLDVKCLQNGSAEISCGVEKGTDPSIYLTVSGELEVYNVTSSERTVRVTVPPVSLPDSWNISCSAKNHISERSTNQTHDACPERSWPGMLSDWSHFLSSGAVFVLYTGLLIFMVNDLRKMKNEKNRCERGTMRRDQVEMEMEPTYFDDGY